jgi:hypothetical protein
LLVIVRMLGVVATRGGRSAEPYLSILLRGLRETP